MKNLFQFFLGLFVLTPLTGFGQATPCSASTNICSTAIRGISCGSWTAPGGGIVDPTCGGAASWDSQYWIQVTTGAGATSLNVDLSENFSGGGTNPMDDISFQIYSSTGGCSDPFTLIGCFDNDAGTGTDENETIAVTGGVTYFIRVFDADGSSVCSGGGRNEDFRACITESGVSPNDICANSITLAENDACQAFSTQYAGNAGDVLPTCYPAGDADQIIWLDFVATNTTMSLDVSDETGLCPPAVAVYSGTCGSLTEEFCQQFTTPINSFNLTGLTIGDTYYVSLSYLDDGGCGGFVDACFNLCGGPLPYDECVGALPIDDTPEPSSNSCSTPNVTDPPPADLCAISLENTSWYNFTVLSTNDVVITLGDIECIGGASGFQIGYFTGTCGSLTNIGCDSGGGGTVTTTISGLTAGQNVYIAVDGNAGSQCNFDISATNTVDVLPIELTNFSAEEAKNRTVDLTWITQSEFNNEFFTVFRSQDGVNFEKVDDIAGAGTSNTSQYYYLKDENPYSGISYYKLKQTDFNGDSEEFDIISVGINGGSDLIAYPNPVKDDVNLSFDASFKQQSAIVMYDVTGVKVFENNYLVNKGENIVIIDTEDLRTGMYFVTLSNNNELETVKFIKE